MDCCKRLRLVASPRKTMVVQALWSSAVVAYAHCFGRGTFRASTEDVRNLPLWGGDEIP
jgi:hypothetical protein